MALPSIKDILQQAGLATPEQFDDWLKAWRVAQPALPCLRLHVLHHRHRLGIPWTFHFPRDHTLDPP